ncbi:MAG: CRTAC1 family protein [Lewinella sp.]|nr:CRTAC1 family protein [Lewinella sp.]
MNYRIVLTLGLVMLAFSCGIKDRSSTSASSSLYTLMDGPAIGIDFANDLTFDKNFNIYTYRNFYNGGGVAVGDVNGDGLEDIYFTANQDKNRLFINKGEFKFEDVTEKAGVGGNRAWSTGVAMADVNGDGWLDIYVCNSGDIEGDNKQNELFINQQDGTFSEEAEAYGIADQGLSTHGVFFDYDHDGDLDLYLLNNSFRAIGSFNLKQNERPVRDSVGGDKLYRNDHISPSGIASAVTFTDVSEEAGIYGSVIGFGLGITVGDIDRDGWQDIYISNDFFERDYIYMNNGDGTFREDLTEQMRSISNASMGADMADLNNDGYPEIFVTEMLPEKDKDIKQKTTFEDWNKYQENLKQDYYHQFTRNTLQLNNGDGTFSEIGRLAGVEATDWSWGALIFDMDNDGKRDLFVANGIYQDLTDQDYIDFIANSATQRMIITREGVDFKTLVDSIPVRPIANYAFHQEGDLSFVNRADEFGLDQLSHSNGSAYSDLDNDGDLDLIVNNVNMPAFIYRNETNKLHPENHYLTFELTGEKDNTEAVGAVVTLKYGDQIQYLEHMPMRGFQSSVGYQMHFGLGSVDQIDSVIVY